ncbi:CU044_5270 family protein [Actinomadura kijaniata]|uniref:CU044_5270 family protein n=1 Tax=Actinomadura kijaniata TaxID=46161 RepID=UPI003F1A1F8A
MNEIELFRAARPETAAYSAEAMAEARRRLERRATPRSVRRRRAGFAAGGALLAAGAASVAVAVAVPGEPERGRLAAAHEGADPVVTLSGAAPMSATQVLGRAARAGDELAPRPGQYIKVVSQTMFSAESNDSDTGRQGRYLYRTDRVIWRPVRAGSPGALKITHLPPKAYPGWPVPRAAFADKGTDWVHLQYCRNADLGTDYTALSRLPTDVRGMRAHLYAAPGDGSPDTRAWERAGDLLRETYLPRAQRAALFRAIATIPGVDAVGGAQDAARRTGLGVGRVDRGIREDLIFDRRTYALLGEREVVVDAAQAKAPVGSLIGSTAQLSVTVTDTLPRVERPRDDRC